MPSTEFETKGRCVMQCEVCWMDTDAIIDCPAAANQYAKSAGAVPENRMELNLGCALSATLGWKVSVRDEEQARPDS